MATTTLTLYKNTELKPEYNYRLEVIESYLSNLPSTDKTAINNFQYIRHALALTIKVDLGQVNALPNAINSIPYNYCSFVSSDAPARPIYYFIVRKTQVASSTVEMTLKMDTINTFRVGQDYTFSDRTMINRQHKDRFIREINYREDTVFHPAYDDEFFENVGEGHYPLLDLASFTRFNVGLTVLTDDTEEGTFVSMLSIDKNDYNKKSEIISASNQLVFVEVGPDYAVISGRDKDGVEESRITINLFELNNKYVSFNSNAEDGIYALDGGELTEEVFAPDWMITIHPNGFSYKRIIDLYSEGVTPTLYKSKDYFLIGNSINTSWYLIFKNRNNYSDSDPDAFSINNPVDCFLCGDVAINTKSQDTDFLITPAMLEYGRYYFISYQLRFMSSSGATYNAIAPLGSYDAYVLVKSGEDNFNIYAVRITYQGGEQTINRLVESGLTNIKLFNNSPVNIPYTTSSSVTFAGNLAPYPIGAINQTFTPSVTTVRISPISEVNRTDARLVKIIKLPYCPSVLRVDDDGDIIIDDWYYNTTEERLQLKDINISSLFYYEFKDFHFETENGEEVNINPLEDISADNLGISISSTLRAKDISLESKLFHSDYYYYKFVYDAFSYVFALEKVNIENYVNEFYVKYGVTKTINSRFLFQFPTYICTEYATEDYYDTLMIGRNNEVTLLNSQYLNYIRTGLNYDIKSNQRTEARSWLGSALGVVGGIASFAIGGAFGKVAGVTAITSSIASIASSVITTAQNEQNIQQKLFQYQNQATSVYGANDIDLLDMYAKNRVKICLYQVSPKMKKALFDMFYYTGYVAGYMGIPDTNSRTWFNFVSCEPVFLGANKIPEECLEDLRERWKAGVTTMHEHNGVYDWERKYENWETSLEIPD